MKGYKEPGLADRQDASRERKKTALKKFRKQAEDPALAQRLTDRASTRAERTAASDKARGQRAEKAAREAESAKQAALTAAEAAQRELELQRTAEIAQEADRKTARDARYAARKARGRR